MKPLFSAFTQELLLLKRADMANAAQEAPPSKEPFKSQVPTLMKERLKSMLMWAPGVGLGVGTGYLAGEVLGPKILPPGWTNSQTKLRAARAAMSGLGAIGGWGTWAAMRRAAEAEDRAVKR